VRTVIAVPRRPDGGIRDRLWDYCRHQWRTEHPGLEIFEGQPDPGPFNRSQAINRAARAAGDFDTIVVIDGDVLIHPDQVRAGLGLVERFDRVVFPFRVYRSVSQAGTSRIMNGWTGDWAQVSIQAYWDSVSCVVMVPRAVWDQVGGFDERFVGWGWEDTAFACATDTVSGRLRVAGPLWHLWHPASPERNSRTVEYRANRELATQYRNAAHVGWDAMLPVLKQPGGPLA
jgi:GT2 family glycosyltransferase